MISVRPSYSTLPAGVARKMETQTSTKVCTAVVSSTTAGCVGIPRASFSRARALQTISLAAVLGVMVQQTRPMNSTDVGFAPV